MANGERRDDRDQLAERTRQAARSTWAGVVVNDELAATYTDESSNRIPVDVLLEFEDSLTPVIASLERLRAAVRAAREAGRRDP